MSAGLQIAKHFSFFTPSISYRRGRVFVGPWSTTRNNIGSANPAWKVGTLLHAKNVVYLGQLVAAYTLYIDRQLMPPPPPRAPLAPVRSTGSLTITRPLLPSPTVPEDVPEDLTVDEADKVVAVMPKETVLFHFRPNSTIIFEVCSGRILNGVGLLLTDPFPSSDNGHGFAPPQAHSLVRRYPNCYCHAITTSQCKSWC